MKVTLKEIAQKIANKEYPIIYAIGFNCVGMPSKGKGDYGIFYTECISPVFCNELLLVGNECRQKTICLDYYQNEELIENIYAELYHFFYDFYPSEEPNLEEEVFYIPTDGIGIDEFEDMLDNMGLM